MKCSVLACFLSVQCIRPYFTSGNVNLYSSHLFTIEFTVQNLGGETWKSARGGLRRYSAVWTSKIRWHKPGVVHQRPRNAPCNCNSISRHQIPKSAATTEPNILPNSWAAAAKCPLTCASLLNQMLLVVCDYKHLLIKLIWLSVKTQRKGGE